MISEPTGVYLFLITVAAFGGIAKCCAEFIDGDTKFRWGSIPARVVLSVFFGLLTALACLNRGVPLELTAIVCGVAGYDKQVFSIICRIAKRLLDDQD